MNYSVLKIKNIKSIWQVKPIVWILITTLLIRIVAAIYLGNGVKRTLRGI